MEGKLISRANIEYENNRDIYPGIESFLPQIKNYFEIYLNNL